MRNIILLGIVFFAFAKINAQQLASYIQEAQDNNPEIQAFELRYNIAEEKVNEANTLPDTQISAGYFISEPETRTGAQRKGKLRKLNSGNSICRYCHYEAQIGTFSFSILL